MGAIPTGDSEAAPDFVSPQLAAAMAHPTRVHAYGILHERTASPREIAKAIGEPLNNVTYHLAQLLKLGCIEPVGTKSVRGGRVLEHFYRAKKRLYFDEDAWRSLSEKQRLDVALVTLRMISRDIAGSMAAGAFFDDDAHICRSPMVVDEEGWREVSEVLERATEGLFEVETRVAERTADDASPGIHMKVGLMQFRAEPFGEEPETDA